MQRIPSVRDIDKTWNVPSKPSVTKRESTPPTVPRTILKRNASSEDLKSDDEERLKQMIVVDLDQVLRRWSDPQNIKPIHDILSVQKLELYAACLAEQLEITSTKEHGRALLPTLKANGAKLMEMYTLLSAAILNKEAISPAAESFVDNFHIIEEQLTIVQQDLPKNYYYELPKLRKGVLAGFPRVYAISLIMVAYTDSTVDNDVIARFVGAYQRVSPLRIGELWAVAITLRIVLFEQLRLLAVRVGDTREKKERANRIADELLALVSVPTITANDLVQMLSRHLGMGTKDELDRTIIVQLAQRLRDQDPVLGPALMWLENQLTDRYNTTTTNVIQMDHHSQAADQVTVQNIIGSMRMLNNINWIEFVENASIANDILRQDPAGAYPYMDFPTRDQYRHAVERIAKQSTASELEVASLVVQKAQGWIASTQQEQRKSHIGYWLIGNGLAEIHKETNYVPTLTERIQRYLKQYPTFFYLGSLLLLTFIAMIPSLYYAWSVDPSTHSSYLSLALYIFLALIPASELSLCFLNHTITLSVKPRPLPSMDTAKGIPSDAKTIVIIPMLFINQSNITETTNHLEIHHLANHDPQLSFALLADYTDADAETTPNDASLLAFAQKRIAELNQRYPAKEFDRFYLFHRYRKWNEGEQRWMGWERKRGKIHEFNLLLRGATDTSYVDVKAKPQLMKQIKYVITLDADTSLPRDAARRLIGVIIHPLNTPYFDDSVNSVTDGYGILQPRVSVDLESSLKSRFSQLFSNYIGIDAYHTSVSDVYQDLFAEGSFVGKGLYVVDIFLAATQERVPENTILSHDLFEGLFVRSALVTEVELYDDHPSDWATFARRSHRWIRGDWQLLPFLFPKIPNENWKYAPNKLSVISKFKMFDNLRRSCVAPAQLLWLVLSWTLLPGDPIIWTRLVLMMFIFPAYAFTASAIQQVLWLGIGLGSWRLYVQKTWEELKVKVAQFILTISFLVEQSFDHVDAIVRTLYRRFYSGKHLLEWTTSAQIESTFKHSSGSSNKLTELGPATAIILTGIIAVLQPRALYIAAPFLISWLLSPWFKIYLRGKGSTSPTLSTDQLTLFRAYARRTWHFFETFVTPEDNWLAPDNFQEDPHPVVAHRVSPTNLGLQMLATISAYDLGFIGAIQCLELFEKIFNTMNQLARFNGHFFNWYDTITLEPLPPKYVSSVDSGNLAGHLLTVKQWCKEPIPTKTINIQAQLGLIDTLIQLNREISQVKIVSLTSGGVTVQQLQDAVYYAINACRRGRWHKLSDWEDFLITLLNHLQGAEDLLNALCIEPSATETFKQVRIWMNSVLTQVVEVQRDLIQLDAEETKFNSRRAVLIGYCESFFAAMDFKFLFDNQRKLFSIGYIVNDNRQDHYHYDLLASESRLSSFIAIAKGEVAQEHWFTLGRQMTAISGGQTLVSWTASMFEYLMPILVMRSYDDTLLHQTYRTVVNRQIEYGKVNGVPWGISEAGYNARDLQLSYQYGPFGVPGLGLKRGLSEDLVVSPYSTMLAAMIDPLAALLNLKALEAINAFGQYGFCESIDYTLKRLPNKQTRYVLQSYMAHHQGMSMSALDNVLNHGVMQNRFHNDPLVRATQLLLQERIPVHANLSEPRADEVRLEGTSYFFSSHPNPRVYSDASLPTPRTQVLSNGSYSVMMTTAGSGYSRCKGIAINRWREDSTRDHWGSFIFIRELGTSHVWCCGYQPIGGKVEDYEVTFAEDKVELVRVDREVVTHTEVIIATADDVELRRVSLTNLADEERVLEVTSFMEVVLASPNDDDSHTTFSNLFVQTEFVETESCLLATRRQRAPNKPQVWAFHVCVVEGEASGEVQYETDRARFIGRGRSAMNPWAMQTNSPPLSNTIGSVLDPIFSLRQGVRIPSNGTVRITFSTGLTSSRDDALVLANKYQDPHLFQREAAMVWTQSQVQLRHLNIDTDKAHLYQRLAGRVLYADSSLRPHSKLLSSNTRVQSNLWPYGISGDLPIILAGINDEKEVSLVRDLLHAHEYLRLKGVAIDLVLLNEHPPSYIQNLQEELHRQISMSASSGLLDKKGGVFVRRIDIMSVVDVILLKSIARVYLRADQGSLEEQTKRRPVEIQHSPPLVLPSRRKESKILLTEPILPMAELGRQLSRQSSISSELVYYNGLGGFTSDAREYRISLADDQWTPAPWINVIANSNNFGCLVSEAGSGYTWSVNSRENRLTPWNNDPISDTPGEAIYIRDEFSGEYWTPTPLPIRESEKYEIRHGAGYTQFSHTSHGIKQQLKVFIPEIDAASLPDAGIKITELVLTNTAGFSRHLSITNYVEWVLGIQRHVSAPSVKTEIDKESKALFASNAYNNEFASRLAFSNVIGDTDRNVTCDRSEFLGRNGCIAQPAAMIRQKLSGTSGSGFDPCAAIRISVTLAANETRRIFIQLGEAANAKEARELISMFKEASQIDAAYTASTKWWDKLLSTIEIKTPDIAMNMLVNRWLLYQTLSCRVWARSAFYQSGGAFGFRDQLQDVMALVYSDPAITRQQLIRAAGRQFPEGDVQHWWHPPTGRGVRTHCSDDALFLPYVLSFYVKVTGDRAILNEMIPFIKADPLAPGQEDSYNLPDVDHDNSASLLDHAIRVADRHLEGGAHGLPFMGSCDWNDGMNMVGNEGKGESVWLAWFLYSTLEHFSVLCTSAGREDRAEAYQQRMVSLKQSIEEQAWDGQWYRRAFFDDGTPLGTASSEECQIDSIAQSWAVLSGAADSIRAKQAMNSADKKLVFRDAQLIKLFTPPFDKGGMNPGYIKGYVPGVRENGGQYTHAAVWLIMAFAEMGDGDRGAELYSMINPINHTSNRAGVQRYKGEPYVMAADVYALPPHTGRAGWSWYTGSSSWMYRAAIEAILGFQLNENQLILKPNPPKHWNGFEIKYRAKKATYKIIVINTDYIHHNPPGNSPLANSTPTSPNAKNKIPVTIGKGKEKENKSFLYELDGVVQKGPEIPLAEDGKEHIIRIQI